MIMAYEARCHCGAVRVAVDAGPPREVFVCYCSHCRVKGLMLAAVPGSAVQITQGDDRLKTYWFNKHVIGHRFCSDCGTQPLSQAEGPDGSPMAMINAHCIPGLDLEAIVRVPYDGASL